MPRVFPRWPPTTTAANDGLPPRTTTPLTPQTKTPTSFTRTRNEVRSRGYRAASAFRHSSPPPPSTLLPPRSTILFNIVPRSFTSSPIAAIRRRNTSFSSNIQQTPTFATTTMNMRHTPYHHAVMATIGSILLVALLIALLPVNVLASVTAGDSCTSGTDIYACNGRNFYMCSQDEWVLQNVCDTDCVGIPSFANNCNRNSIGTSSSSASTSTSTSTRTSTSIYTATSTSDSVHNVSNPTKARLIYGPILGVLGLILIIFAILFVYRYRKLHGLEKKLVIVEGPGGMRIIVDPDYQPKTTEGTANTSAFDSNATLSNPDSSTAAAAAAAGGIAAVGIAGAKNDKTQRKNAGELRKKKSGNVAIPGFAGRTSTQTEKSPGKLGRSTTISSALSSVAILSSGVSSMSSDSKNGKTSGNIRGINTATVFPEEEATSSNKVTSIAEVLQQEYVVIHKYNASAPDEINLNLDDTIKIDLLFNDGWAQGYNITTEQGGLLPCSCLAVANRQPTGKLDTSKPIKHNTDNIDKDGVLYSVTTSPTQSNISNTNKRTGRKSKPLKRSNTDYGLVGYQRDKAPDAQTNTNINGVSAIHQSGSSTTIVNDDETQTTTRINRKLTKGFEVQSTLSDTLTSSMPQTPDEGTSINLEDGRSDVITIQEATNALSSPVLDSPKTPKRLD